MVCQKINLKIWFPPNYRPPWRNDIIAWVAARNFRHVRVLPHGACNCDSANSNQIIIDGSAAFIYCRYILDNSASNMYFPETLKRIVHVYEIYYLLMVAPHPRRQSTSAILQSFWCCSPSPLHILNPHSQIISPFGQDELCTSASFRLMEAWHCVQFISISWQWTVTCCWATFRGTSSLQLLHLTFTFASNCSANMLRQNPVLGCLHIWQVLDPPERRSAQCPQSACPHGLVIWGFTIG